MLALLSVAPGCEESGPPDAALVHPKDLAVPPLEDLAVEPGPDLVTEEDLAEPPDLTVQPDLRVNPLLLSFAPAVTYATDPSPGGLVAADLNGDTHVDLAVTNSDGPGLMVFLGKGDGTLSLPDVWNIGGPSEAVVSGDFDGDGLVDLCASNVVPAGVRVLLGHGDATFDVSGSFPAKNDAYGLVAGDFNRDKKLDVATIGRIAGGVCVFLGVGDGTFAPYKQLGRNLGTEHLAAGDMDGDGIVDLLVPTTGLNSNELIVMKGDGKGWFAEVAIHGLGRSPRGVAVGDLDGDKNKDVVVAQYTDNPADVRVLLGTGNGNLAPAVPYLTRGDSPMGLTLADLNNDRVPDVVVATSPDSVEVLGGRGDGRLVSLGSYACGVTPRAVVATDLNHDGRLDLVATVRGANRLCVLINTSSR